MRAKILIAAATKTRARELAQSLDYLNQKVDILAGRDQPDALSSYRLLIWEREPSANHDPIMDSLGPNTHIILILPKLNAKWISFYIQDRRINHFLASPLAEQDLHSIIDKLVTGDIFGMERYLPSQVNICYRRLSTFKERCDTLEEIDTFAKLNRLRSQTRRATLRVAEELLMNAMYQAPMDKQGRRIFADIDPAERIHHRTPRPISLRYACQKGAFYLNIRDRFGSFKRDDLAHYLLRCVTESSPIEQKKLGAGLGLYQIASTATRFVINILPGSVSEFICTMEPAGKKDESVLKMLSVTTQRPYQAVRNTT